MPEIYLPWGQSVLIGGSMATDSCVLAGRAEAGQCSLASACHDAGRGIRVRGHSRRGLAEEAPGAYKDVAAAEAAGLARRVARLSPLVCVKG